MLHAEICDDSADPPLVNVVGVGPRRVRSIYGIGRNYAAHARELGNAVPDEPVVFMKPSGTLIGDGGRIVLPRQSQDVQHEVEIAVLLGRCGRNLEPTDALGMIAAYGVGIDVTARDIQSKARAAGNPWTIAKGFDTFAPVSPLVPAEQIESPQSLEFELAVNGMLRQQGRAKDMVFGFAELVAYLSTVFTLQAGDLIFTGTPEGVARIMPGDILHARLLGHPADLRVTAVGGPSH
jgi:2-keto-4-pentenoate hydratase/2-oxohepta-3-ene-1,7-dioic acid hydratase in catechol pathway